MNAYKDIIADYREIKSHFAKVREVAEFLPLKDEFKELSALDVEVAKVYDNIVLAEKILSDTTAACECYLSKVEPTDPNADNVKILEFLIGRISSKLVSFSFNLRFNFPYLADVNLPNHCGETLLLKATQFEDDAHICKLLLLKADPFLADRWGNSAFTEAQQQGNEVLVELFTSMKAVDDPKEVQCLPPDQFKLDFFRKALKMAAFTASAASKPTRNQ
jgi:hypothetical protein